MATRRDIRRILVAIRDLDRAPRHELRKAAELARAFNARIELFHAAEIALRGHVLARDRADHLRSHAQAQIERGTRRLKQFSRLSALRGVAVTVHVNSDFPPHEAIVRRALHTDAHLVIAGTGTRGPFGRLVPTGSDWELIRECPSLLLLVKSARPYSGSTMLVAVDPFHAHAKPSDLDTKLLVQGGAIAHRMSASLHVFHAYVPLIEMAPGPAGPVVAFDLPPEAQAAYTDLVGHTVLKLAARAGVPAAACHVQMGPVAGELCALAKSLRASLVILGAVSRSGLRRLFIGATAERVLDALTCDVLVVKPRDFTCSVGRRSRAIPLR